MSLDHPLRHALVTAGENASPARWALFLHGILGSGANWRTIARRFVQAKPDWGAVLVDLREHGGSTGRGGPNTVEACARDLVDLEPHVPGPIRGVLGHSFGGKVALDFARTNAERLGLETLWLVDSNPGVRLGARGSESTVAVVDMLRAMPEWFETRQAFIDAVQARGHGLAIAQWLAMNLDRGEHGVRFGLDLEAIRALLDDYFARDLWSVLEAPPGAMRVVVINGGRSQVWSDDDRRRIVEIAGRTDRVAVHEIPSAGHWVHAEAPEELLAILTA